MSLDVSLYAEDGACLYTANITHNLTNMAAEAGLYTHLWRPDEIGTTHAHQLIEPLIAGITLLATEKRHYEQFNAANGWGTWKDFLPFCAEYLQACRDNPSARVVVSR